MDASTVIFFGCLVGVVIMNLLISRSKKSRRALRKKRNDIRERLNKSDDGDVA